MCVYSVDQSMYIHTSNTYQLIQLYANASCMQETSRFYVNTDIILLHFVIYCHFVSCFVVLEGEQKKSRQAQNFAINKKSTIVVQSLWNLVKIFISWVLYVARISAGLDQNCGFFTNSKVLGQSG